LYVERWWNWALVCTQWSKKLGREKLWAISRDNFILFYGWHFVLEFEYNQKAGIQKGKPSFFDEKIKAIFYDLTFSYAGCCPSNIT